VEHLINLHGIRGFLLVVILIYVPKHAMSYWIHIRTCKLTLSS